MIPTEIVGVGLAPPMGQWPLERGRQADHIDCGTNRRRS